jgi:hypothetical protein
MSITVRIYLNGSSGGTNYQVLAAPRVGEQVQIGSDLYEVRQVRQVADQGDPTYNLQAYTVTE